MNLKIIKNYGIEYTSVFIFIVFAISYVSSSEELNHSGINRPSSKSHNSALDQCYLAYNHVYNDLKNNASNDLFQHMARILTLSCQYDIIFMKRAMLKVHKILPKIKKSAVRIAKVKLYYVLCLTRCYATDDSGDQTMAHKECRYCPVEPKSLNITQLTSTLLMGKSKGNSSKETPEYTRCKQTFKEVRKLIRISDFNEDFNNIDNSINASCRGLDYYYEQMLSGIDYRYKGFGLHSEQDIRVDLHVLGSICRLYCPSSPATDDTSSPSSSTTPPTVPSDVALAVGNSSTASAAESCATCLRTSRLEYDRRKVKQDLENNKCKLAEEKAWTKVRSRVIHYSDGNIAMGLIAACTTNHSEYSGKIIKYIEYMDNPLKLDLYGVADIRRMLAIVCGVGCAGDPSDEAECPLCRLVIREHRQPSNPRHGTSSAVVKCMDAARAVAAQHLGTRAFSARRTDANKECKDMFPVWDYLLDKYFKEMNYKCEIEEEERKSMIESRNVLCANLCSQDNRIYSCDDCPLRTVLATALDDSSTSGESSVGRAKSKRGRRGRGKAARPLDVEAPAAGHKDARLRHERLLQTELEKLLADTRRPIEFEDATTTFADPYLQRSGVTDASVWNHDEDSVEIGEPSTDVEPQSYIDDY